MPCVRRAACCLQDHRSGGSACHRTRDCGAEGRRADGRKGPACAIGMVQHRPESPRGGGACRRIASCRSSTPLRPGLSAGSHDHRPAPLPPPPPPQTRPLSHEAPVHKVSTMDPTPVLGSGPCPCRLGTYADPTTLLYALFPLWSLQHLLTAQVRPRAAAACRRCCAPGHDPGAPSPCTPLYIALHFALNCLAYGVACDVMAAASEQSEIYWGFPAAVGWAVRCVGLYLLLLCLMDPGRSFDFRMQYYYHHRVAEGAGPGDAGIRPRGLSRVTRHLLLLGACITSLSFLLDAAVQGKARCPGVHWKGRGRRGGRRSG